MRYQPLIDRLIQGVPILDDDGCWLWQGSKDASGYGRVWGDGKSHLAHRRVYEVFYGLDDYSLRPDQVVMHKCDTPLCVNPMHLALGTQAENIADRDKKGRQKAPNGERHGNAKLTDEAVRDIRSGTGWKEYAKKYGVSRSLTLMVRAGQGWKHVK